MSQTKSLDRDVSKKQRKVNYPQNVQKVSNATEHIVCHYHNQIEHIFGCYPIKLFSEQLSPENVTDLINDLRKKIDIKVDNLSNVYGALRQFCSVDYIGDPHYLLLRYVEFIMKTDKLLIGINSKLSQTVTYGLVRYCVSLANYCTTDIHFLVNYEKIIQRNAQEIIKEVKDIRHQYLDFKRITKGHQNRHC